MANGVNKMAHHLITETLIEREALLCALRLGLIGTLSKNINYKAEYNLKDDQIHLYATHKDKFIDLPFKHEQLCWTIDDLAERYIYPAIKKLLDRDLSFIHNDET